MDKHGNIHQHSKEKLDVYREYLLAYLSVLTHVRKLATINIIDLFAGMGVSENKQSGSALIAATVIDGFSKKSGKNLRLFLNEGNREYYKKLMENLSKFKFSKITNKSADDFVDYLFSDGCLSPRNRANSHSFLFVDPFGYTQLSQENLDKLFVSEKIEILLFVPTNEIYRFAGAKGNPARQFLIRFGIEESDMGSIVDVEKFAEKFKSRIKEKAQTDFVYSYGLRNKKAHNSMHHLYFVTKHVAGARKFLDAKNSIKKKLETQVKLFDGKEFQRESDLLELLSQNLTSAELYTGIIKKGHVPSEINPVLKQLDDAGILKVGGDPTRRKKRYYLEEKSRKHIHMRIINHV